MDEEDDGLEPLFDYQQQAPSLMPLEDDDDDDDDVLVVESRNGGGVKKKAQRRKPGPKEQIDTSNTSNSDNTRDVDVDDDESWLAPPPKVARTTTTNSLNMALRMKSAELISMTEKASRDVQELYARQERAAAAARAQAAHEDVEPIKKIEKVAETVTEKVTEKILIKVQDKAGAIQSFRLGMNDKLHKLFTGYASFAKTRVTDLVFRFDGETVHEDSTPSDLDLENEDIIEVFIKTSARQ